MTTKLLQLLVQAGDVSNKFLPNLLPKAQFGVIIPSSNINTYDNIPNPATLRSNVKMNKQVVQKAPKNNILELAEELYKKGSLMLESKSLNPTLPAHSDTLYPGNKYMDAFMSTPNIRTKNDESFKKGHPLTNEQKAIVLHHTGYTDTARDNDVSWAMREVDSQFRKPGESSHVVIDFNGKRYNYANPNQVTYHAGKSSFDNRDNVNDFSLGVEFQGDTDKRPLTKEQIESFVEYAAPIIKKNKIPLNNIVTHKQIRSNYMKSNPNDKNTLNKPDVNDAEYNRILKYLKEKGYYKYGGQPCYECGGMYAEGGYYDCPDQEKDPVTGKCKAEEVRSKEQAAANKAAGADLNAWAKQVAAMDKENAKQDAAQYAGQLGFDYDWMQSPLDKAEKKAAIAGYKQFFQQNPNTFVPDDTSGFSPEQKYIIASKLKQKVSTPMGSKAFKQKFNQDPNFFDLGRLQSDIVPTMGGWSGIRNWMFNNKADGGPIVDPMGQWAHPGKVTRIPSDNITMKGVNYPVLGIGSNGKSIVMYPNQEYSFGGSQYVDEYPVMGKGGEMIRRADGSYSRRGLWDNIRANKGSGKKPTKDMLEQEKKIKAKNMANGGTNNAGFDALPEYVQAKILSNMGYGGYYNPIMAEGGEPNGGMALGQMMAVADKMNKLRQFISPDKNLDPWIASKLAVMDESADAISDYMMYNPEAQGMEQEMPEMGGGGYTVTRSNDRKGKTHKVTGPDGTVKYFGDSKLGQHPKDPERKAAFYARHKKNLAGNPFFRAFARKTWEDGGSTFSGNAWYQDGGYTSVADYAKASGRGSSYKERKAMAESMGISGYRGTEDQNMQLLNMLKSQDQQARYIPADMDNSEYNETADQTAARVSNIKSAYSKIRNNASPVTSPTKKTIVTAQQQQKPADMTYEQFMSLANSVGPKLVSQKQVEAMRDKNGYISEIKNTPVSTKPKEDNKTSSNKVIKEFMNNIGAGNSIDFSNYNKPAVVNSTKSAKDEEAQKANDAIVMNYIKRKEKESDSRYLESGMIADKGTNTMHVVQNGKVVKSFPVLTGKNRDANENTKGVKYLDSHPEERATPVGSYMSSYANDVYGAPGFYQTGIPAFGADAPLAKDIATHVTYPGDFKRRNALYDQPANKRNASYGCINCKKPDMEYLANTFPQGDTTMVIDSRKGKDAKFLKNTYGVKAYGGVAEGQEMEVTPEEAEMLRQQGYQFEII